MRKVLFVIVALVTIYRPLAKADEGMWLPIFIDRLNYVDMQKMGLQLTPEEIYSVNHSSIKDAIVQFGGGCTAEVISDQGLLLTNHHCGYSRIQAHSSLEHDYLTNGFWAETLEDELPNPGLSVSFLVRIEDVTSRVLAEVIATMTEDERNEKINAISETIKKEATDGTSYKASVRGFYEGNEYYLFVYEIYTDVRLVGTPPSSIGKFGADTDNWMWPRQTGDFSIFRIYSDKDGKPAEYSTANIPFKPKHSLPVSIAGVQKGDFSMIMGYPGRTERYMTSFGVKMALDIHNQTVVDIRDKKLKIIMDDMQSNNGIRIKYASKYARISNYWKYYIGQTKGLNRLRVYDKKVALESEFTDWVNASPERKEKYGKAMTDISEAYKQLTAYELVSVYQSEAIRGGSEILNYAGSFSALEKELSEKEINQEKVDKLFTQLKERATNYFKDYNAPTDQKLLAAMLEMYYKNVPEGQQPEYLKKVASKYKGDFGLFAEKVFNSSHFASQQSVEVFLSNPSAKAINKDLAYQTAKEMNNYFSDNIRPKMTEAYNLLDKGNRDFIAGLREMNPDKKFYPDANSTMRLTYGQVLDYYPADAVHYKYYTTLSGVMEKEDPDNWEFVVPEKLKELYKNKDYGKYGEVGELRVCFLTNHDITGGNSGSPVMNGKGELIGIAFDGNWEAMSGDIAYEPELQRTINVDIRYVLFIIDKFAGATRLIDEMNIVSNRVMPKKELMEKQEFIDEETEL
jgi:hypothetical protein